MRVMARSISLAIGCALAGLSGCGLVEDRGADNAAPGVPEQTSTNTAYFCGQSPSSITYWASQWQLEIMDADGVIGGCDFDAACLPSCWGGSSNWTSWSGPLISCPCR